MFLLFTGQTYYPIGGANDFHSSGEYLFELVEKAKSYLSTGEGQYCDDWWHIISTDSKKIVAGSRTQGFNAPEIIPETEALDKYKNQIQVEDWCFDDN